MDATALYLQTRIGYTSFSSSRYEKHLEKFENLMGEFEKRIQGSGDRRALGLMKGMYVALLLEKPGARSEKDLSRISTIATEASDLLPTSSEAMSLAALTQFATMIPSVGLSHASSKLENNLLQALSTDPSNIYLKANLEWLWQMRSSYDKSNWKNSKLLSLRKRFQKDSRIEQIMAQ